MSLGYQRGQEGGYVEMKKRCWDSKGVRGEHKQGPGTMPFPALPKSMVGKLGAYLFPGVLPSCLLPAVAVFRCSPVPSRVPLPPNRNPPLCRWPSSLSPRSA